MQGLISRNCLISYRRFFRGWWISSRPTDRCQTQTNCRACCTIANTVLFFYITHRQTACRCAFIWWQSDEFFPCPDPVLGDKTSVDAIETLVIPRTSDIGGLEVRRALPTVRRRLVGPFIFFDRMGPAVLKDGDALDVRPHPHIGLSTVTYLFDGHIRHRDSLGTEMVIRPGM